MKKLCFHRFVCSQAAFLVLTAFFLAPGLRPATGLAQTPITLLDINSSLWRFSDIGADLGTAWRNPVYTNEASWKTGTGLFGVESTVPYPYQSPVRTAVVLGGNRMTHYFRANFMITHTPASLIVTATAYADDGAVFYVNGTEVGRVRMTNNPVTFASRAQVANPEGVAVNLAISSSLLVTGTNIFAVEVHQNATASTDIVFGLGLSAVLAEPPALLTPAEPADRVVNQGQSTLLSVIGTGTPTPVYSWFHNDVAVPGASGPSLALNNFSAANAGAYFVVLANAYGTATSRVAQVSYVPDTNAPVVLYVLGLSDATQTLLVFNEPLDETTAIDLFNWDVRRADTGETLTPFAATLTDRTNLVLNTVGNRDPSLRYEVINSAPIYDMVGNTIPMDTVFPMAVFTNEVLLLNSSQPWRFEPSGTDPGTTWRDGSFDDASWTAGTAPLDAWRGFTPPPFCRTDVYLEDSSLFPVGTCISLSNANNTAQVPAAYFRTHFNYTGDTTNSVLQLEMLIDDGAVIYLNGRELCRTNMGDGPVIHDSLAPSKVDRPAFTTFFLDADGLAQGDNVLAVEVHQYELTDGDLTMGARLSVIGPELAIPPQLSVSFAAGNITVSWTPAVGRLQSSTNLVDWSDVTPSQPPNLHSEAATGERKFFRIATP